MSLWTVFLIGIGLSMDAFAVALGCCAHFEGRRRDKALRMGIFFGGFQALMPFLGWILGTRLVAWVSPFDHWLAFGLLAFIGGKMVLEGFRREGAECARECLTLRTLFILAVATSIDALAVGLTLALLDVFILWPMLIIGGTTFVLSFAGVFIGEKLGSLAGRWFDIAGGLVLIGIGMKILIEHLAS